MPKEIRQKLDIREGDTLLLDTDGFRATIKKGKTIFDFKGALPNLGMSIDKIQEKAVARGVGADE